MFALAASAFVLNLNTNVLGALLPFLKRDLGIDDDGSKLLVAAAGLGSAVGALCVAGLSRRFGRRAVLAASLGVFALVSLAHVFTQSFWPFAALRALSGVAVGVSYAAASAAAADLAPYERRGAVLGRFNAGMFLAIPVGLPLAVYMASLDLWPWIFAVQAGVGLLALLLSLRAVPDAVEPPTSGPRLTVLRHQGVLAGLLATMLHVGSFFVVVQLATTWLDDNGYVPREQQMWLWVGLGALSVVGSAGLSRFADVVGKRSFVLIGSAVLVTCFLVLWRQPGPLVLLLVACVLAVAAAARTGPLQALLTGLVPKERFGALMGLRGFGMQLGVGAFALGSAALPGDFSTVLLLAAGCQLLSYAAIRFGVREPG